MSIKAIRNIYANAVTVRGDEAWDANGNAIVLDESLIQAEITRLQTEYDSNLYQRQRATDYPSLQDQADMQYWDSVNGTTTWLDAINEIKTRYPKP